MSDDAYGSDIGAFLRDQDENDQMAAAQDLADEGMGFDRNEGLSCNHCGSVALEPCAKPDEDGLVEYRCGDCGHYQVSEVLLFEED